MLTVITSLRLEAAGQLLRVSPLEHGINSGQIRHSRGRGEVVMWEHRMRFAAAEVGLELHDRVTPMTGDTLHRAY